MFKSSEKTSLPNASGCLQEGVFINHFLNNPVQVELDNGELVNTCHIVADGRRFNYRNAFGIQGDWTYVLIKQFSYTDGEGKLQVIDVAPKHPHLVTKGNVTSVCGHVTNIGGKRWGVTVNINWATGDTQIHGDQSSPIVGCLIQLIE